MARALDTRWLRELARIFSERQNTPGGCTKTGPSYTPGGCLKGRINGKSPGRCYRKQNDTDDSYPISEH